MTDHKGLPVSGYKPQSDAKVALVNEFKADEERLLRKIDALLDRDMTAMAETIRNDTRPEYVMDHELTRQAQEHFLIGFMLLNRAVFQPGRVKLPEDGSDD